MLKIITLIIGITLSFQLNAEDRMCFGQAPSNIGTNLIAKITIAENDLFKERKCSTFFPYYEKHVDFSKAECNANQDQLSLDKGYAPFPAFFRATDSSSTSEIKSYDWEITQLFNSTVVTYNGFNAAHVFDEPGDYTVTLTITDQNGYQSTGSRTITVWARDGKSYYVDSELGDDRFDGLAQQVDYTCSADAAPIGTCTGPWKTATRAFGELAPRNVTSYPNGKYTADGICLAKETVDIVRYKQGNFKIFRSSTFVESEALKDSDGAYLPAVATEICTTLADARTTNLRPGDQVLFNRGQTFDLETGLNTLSSYEADNQGVHYNYERLDTKSISTIGHWSKAIGVSFGAYGQGVKPVIKNTGAVSSIALHLKGVGMFNLSVSDLNFDLRSDSSNTLANRATLATMTGNPNNITFQRVEVNNMHQGIIANSNSGSGLFVFNSKFHDSIVTQLYTQNSYNDVAIANNSFDYSANHLIYSSINSGFVYNNKLSRPAFGRTAYRLAGGTFNNPNQNVWVSDNEISGWIDPRTSTSFGEALNGRAFNNGLRYNYVLVDISPNVGHKDKAIHNVTFTRNNVTDAETLLQLGATENINIFNNVFQSADSGRSSRVSLSDVFSRRPLKNIQIHDNKFIELAASLRNQSESSSFINLRNYDRIKCSDQFNHEKISIENNTFYVPHNQRGIFSFSPLKQGNDEFGNPLANLSLDEAESFITAQVILSNNQLYSPTINDTTLRIGGDFRAHVTDPSTIDWTNFYKGTSSTGGEYRLYNQDSSLTNSLGANTWASSSTVTTDEIIATTSTPDNIQITWEELIAYAQQHNINPTEIEALILNQILLVQPTYSGGTTVNINDRAKTTSIMSNIPKNWINTISLAESSNIIANNIMLDIQHAHDNVMN